MLRTTAITLLILALAVSAAAKDRDRKRRNPRSAAPPPVDYEAIRKKVDLAVRPRLARWLEARKKARDPATDAASVENFHMSPSWSRWGRARTDPTALDGILISEFRIDEIRVLGRNLACALVGVKNRDDPEGPWRADVSYWYAVGKDWRARPHWAERIPADYGILGFPPSARPQPRHEPEAVAVLARTRGLLYPPLDGSDHRVEFVVRCRAPGAERAAVFEVRGSLRRKFTVTEKVLPLREGKCGDVDAQRHIIESLLADLLGEGLLPAPAEYHLVSVDSGIVADGFAPERHLETVMMSIDEEGRPLSIARILVGRTTSTHLSYVVRGSRHLVSGWERETGGVKETLEVRWRRQRPDWVPEYLELTRPEGTYEITSSSR